jgi:hypothetical protein
MTVACPLQSAEVASGVPHLPRDFGICKRLLGREREREGGYH